MATYAKCVLGLLCVLSLSVAASANGGYHDPDPTQPAPTAWAWISSQPDLTTAAQVLTVLGADKQLMGPITSTLLLPTNEAFANYLSLTRAPLDLTGAFSSFWKLFLGKLIDYHVLLRSVSPMQDTPEYTYTTKYRSINGGTHKVTYVADSGCSPQKPSYTHGKPGVGMLCPTAFIRDEQQNTVTFAGAGTKVLGGGQISTINAVLQPSDIFPSLAAAVTGPDFSILRDVVNAIDTGLNITLLSELEKVPGTLAAPTNQAFAGVDVSKLDATTLLAVVRYHFCGPVQADYNLVYTPFFKSKNNPCLTLLGTVLSNNKLKLTYKMKNNGLVALPTLWINYPTGSATAPSTGTSNITIADITIPLHVAHAITKLLVPPQ